MMADENTATPAASEQPAPVGPSQPSLVAESSPAPAGEVKAPESKAPEVDLDAIRRQVAEETRERTRHEVASEYGKKLSETKRAAQEAARLEREQLLASLSDFVPDTQLESLKSQYTARQQAQAQQEETEQVKAELAAYKQATAMQQAASQAIAYAQKYEYDISTLPAEVRGDSPVGFKERFDDFLADEVKKLKKKVVAEAKKAAEEAARDTERKLGVTTVSGSAPVGKGPDDLTSLRAKLRDAYERGDRADIKALSQKVEEAAYRR